METKESKSMYSGKISNVGILDFTGMKSSEELSKISEIEQVGVILVPESLQSALVGIPQKNVGAVIPIPVGDKVRIQAGQIQVSGDAFENGEDDVTMIIAGQLIITSKVTKIGFKKMIVLGQVLAPKGSEPVLGAGISLSGQVFYYAGDNPRIFIGDDCLSKGFFELLEKPIYMVVIGAMHFESDVTVQLLKEKVAGIGLVGSLFVSKELVPIAQVLCAGKVGRIEIKK